jgi:ribulose-phosphate 3-epimerase
MQQKIRIAPSVLAADFARIGDDVRAISDAGADMIHLDVMDGHFVPNLSFGADVVAALRPYSELPFDVHLMISPVDPYIDAFVDAGADCITVHAEAGPHLHRTLQRIRQAGKRAGVAINPATPVQAIEAVLADIDLVLVMTVNPGFGGQSFISSQLGKIREVRALLDGTGRRIDLEVDGGINETTAGRAVDAGADILVAGSASFAGGPKDYAGNIARLRAAAASAQTGGSPSASSGSSLFSSATS